MDEGCGELGMGKRWDLFCRWVLFCFALLHWDYSPGLASQRVGMEWDGMSEGFFFWFGG
jgi:hypothetical protein